MPIWPYFNFGLALLDSLKDEESKMPKPRKSLISLQDTSYYHCVSRCVRRAFLCGQDELTGQSYEHRRGWIEDKMLFLARVFAIDICAYAVMSNHTHLVLHVDAEKANNWSIREVLECWHRLHKGTQFTEKYLENKVMAEFHIWIKERFGIWKLWEISKEADGH